MALVTPNVGELELLDKMLKDALSVDESYYLDLFNNDVTVASDTVATDFVTTTFTDYGQKTMTRANWSVAATVGDKGSSTYSSQLSWTCGATGDTVYGYFVTGVASGTVLWAERFATERILAQNDILNLTPKFTLDSEATTSP